MGGTFFWQLLFQAKNVFGCVSKTQIIKYLQACKNFACSKKLILLAAKREFACSKKLILLAAKREFACSKKLILLAAKVLKGRKNVPMPQAQERLQ